MPHDPDRSGGIGKTRLALRAADGLSAAFPDGIWFVRLESIREVDLVLPTIAQTVGVPDSGAGDILTRLIERVSAGSHHFILDNFEQIVDAGPIVASLLTAYPGTKVLATTTSGRDAEDVLAARVGLNRREFAALRLFVAGRSNSDIADELGISPAMATALIGRLYTKVGVDSRAGLTAFAFKHGIV